MQDERDTLAALPATGDAVTTYRPAGGTMREEWDTADTEGRRQLMLDLGVRVYVTRAPQRGKLTVAQMEGRFRMEITNTDALAVMDAHDALTDEDWLNSPGADAAREAAGVRGVTIRV